MPACLPLLRLALAAAALALVPCGAQASTTLYDPALGTPPSAQGWSPLALGGVASQGVAGGVYALDTTGAGVSIWGNGRVSPVLLDTQAGFDLSFSLQLLGETHTSPNRSGYSLLLVGAQASRALELDFWADHRWAQNYDASQPDRFMHDTGVAFDTTAALTRYTLAVRQQQFTLPAGGLAGLALRRR